MPGPKELSGGWHVGKQRQCKKSEWWCGDPINPMLLLDCRQRSAALEIALLSSSVAGARFMSSSSQRGAEKQKLPSRRKDGAAARHSRVRLMCAVAGGSGGTLCNCDKEHLARCSGELKWADASSEHDVFSLPFGTMKQNGPLMLLHWAASAQASSERARGIIRGKTMSSTSKKEGSGFSF